jgi:HSP20 family protein
MQQGKPYEGQNTDETPVKLYRSDERVMIAAPFPGLEPQDIQVHVTREGEVVLEGRLRGAFKGDKEVILDEWSPGPYYRRVSLNTPVTGEMANVTYENGVIVIALPISQEMRAAEIRPERVSRTEGRRYGNSGHPVGPPADRFP